jgi:hypothetical protein
MFWAWGLSHERDILFPLKMASFGTIENFNSQWYDALVEKIQPWGWGAPSKEKAIHRKTVRHQRRNFLIPRRVKC